MNAPESVAPPLQQKILVSRQVTVDRTQTLEEAVLMGHRTTLHVDTELLATMPKNGDDAPMNFIQLGYRVEAGGLTAELAKHKYTLDVDLLKQALINKVYHTFADRHPNGVQWLGTDGNLCCMLFGRWGIERYVSVRLDHDSWNADWWFPVRCI